MRFKGTCFQDHEVVASARLCNVAAAVVGGAVISGLATTSAANKASKSQQQSAQSGIDAEQQQFDAINEMLAPYRLGGEKALAGQQDLVGLNGNGAQAAAIQALQSSPQFTSALQQGENSILQNASATGGLRGGNTQAALAQYSPALLAQTINDQYTRLGGIATMGQNAAAQTGSFGQASVNNVSSLLQQQGAASAGSALAQGRAYAGIGQGLAFYGAYGGAGGGSGAGNIGNAGYGNYKAFYDNGGGF